MVIDIYRLYNNRKKNTNGIMCIKKCGYVYKFGYKWLTYYGKRQL